MEALTAQGPRADAAHGNAARQPTSLASAVVSVLDVDPDLGAGIAEAERPLAARAAIAPGLEVERGEWDWIPPNACSGVSTLIIDGLLLVRVAAGSRAHVELLGPGDLASPWVGTGIDFGGCGVTARVIRVGHLAVLDRGFWRRTARWPEIHAALMQRVMARTERLAAQSAINSLPRVEERLDLTLWQLADRFGRVTPQGILLSLPITHAQLAEILGAQRPSVSMAVARLREQDRIRCLGRGGWLLLPERSAIGPVIKADPVDPPAAHPG